MGGGGGGGTIPHCLRKPLVVRGDFVDLEQILNELMHGRGGKKKRSVKMALLDKHHKLGSANGWMKNEISQRQHWQTVLTSKSASGVHCIMAKSSLRRY